MSLPRVVSQEQWLKERKELLAEEKAMTRARDRLNAKRRELPMVKVAKEYTFEGPYGPARLIDLFDGRSQLMIQHYMFDPAWENACPSCTASIDELSPALLNHLNERDTTFVGMSRAPIEKIESYRKNRGWTFPWYSSFGSDFNYDFNVTIDSSVQPVMFNYRDAEELETHGDGWLNNGSSEQPGLSVFLRDGDEIFHTYSTYQRGMESLGGAYFYLDLTALGRQEDWEEPKGRVAKPLPNEPVFAI
jgi:predicted dithiol-disulfide oxidoreductase (DUF899 family)